jgi:uncharacterized pyridoxal phosphate-containing UPF0001 family protein
MAQSFLIIFLFLSLPVRADLFDFATKKSESSRIPALVQKLRGLEMKDGPEFEELFNQTVKGIENAVEEGSTLVRVGTALFGQRPRSI